MYSIVWTGLEEHSFLFQVWLFKLLKNYTMFCEQRYSGELEMISKMIIWTGIIFAFLPALRQC